MRSAKKSTGLGSDGREQGGIRDVASGDGPVINSQAEEQLNVCEDVEWVYDGVLENDGISVARFGAECGCPLNLHHPRRRTSPARV